MARKSKAEKQFDNAYDQAFKRLANGVQFDIMDLGKMRDETLAAFTSGKTLDDALKEAIAKYRQN